MTILCQFKSWKYNVMFTNTSEGIKCKISLLLCCLPHTHLQFTVIGQGLVLFGLFPICNIIFQTLINAHIYCIYSKALILKHSLTLRNTNTYIWFKKRVCVLQFWKYETKIFLDFVAKIFLLQTRQMKLYILVSDTKMSKLTFWFSI